MDSPGRQPRILRLIVDDARRQPRILRFIVDDARRQPRILRFIVDDARRKPRILRLIVDNPGVSPGNKKTNRKRAPGGGDRYSVRGVSPELRATDARICFGVSLPACEFIDKR
jgi:hypothetical protein